MHAARHTSYSGTTTKNHMIIVVQNHIKRGTAQAEPYLNKFSGSKHFENITIFLDASVRSERVSSLWRLGHLENAANSSDFGGKLVDYSSDGTVNPIGVHRG